MEIDFTNKTVIVTGGTRGIGASLVDTFYQAGAIVYGTGTQEEQIKELNQQYAKDARRHYWAVDFTQKESLDNLSNWIDSLPSVDVLINNAGVNKINPVDQIQEEDWDLLQQVNLKGVYLLTQLVSRKMIPCQSGKIVNVASIFGVVSKAKRSVYSTTKFGLIGFTKGIALDLAPYNILVNSISPGFVMTELTLNILSSAERDELAQQVPLQRFAQPEEIANTVLFLASDLNTYLTGQNIVVDGGFVSH